MKANFFHGTKWSDDPQKGCGEMAKTMTTFATKTKTTVNIFTEIGGNGSIQTQITFRSCLPTAGLIFSSTIKITIPLSSIPLLPARPDIWMYSPDVI